MKKKRVMTCLAAGVCILAVSATAAFGSVNGYANYKTAVKSLALETDNVSASGAFTVAYDGADVLTGQMDFSRDGSALSWHTLISDGTETSEEWNTELDGKTTWFSSDDPFYRVYDSGDPTEVSHGLLGGGEDDEFSHRLVNFLEMGADTVMGDLKNNVVEIGASNGEYTYQLDISKGQVPAVVNAGLSLMAYAATESAANTSYVDFEDWDQAAVNYYRQQTGQELSEDFLAHYQGEINDDTWWENNEELEKFEELEGEMHGHYYEELEKKMDAINAASGVLYVANDGTTTFYSDVVAYEQSKGLMSVDDIDSYIGQDLALENVHFTFTVNKAEELTANHCVANFVTVDKKGGSHTVTITGDVSFFDYGSTVVQPLDTGDRVSWDEYSANMS